MKWVAVVPLKGRADCKSRLASRFSVLERLALSEGMAGHVVRSLIAQGSADPLYLLSSEPIGVEGTIWCRDEACDLNSSLCELRAVLGHRPILVIHADLPLLTPDDVRRLLEAAERAGAAIAPDRHGTGTNAIAISDGRPFEFRFGTASFPLHVAQGQGWQIVRREGLMIDLDTPEDLDLIGGRLSIPIARIRAARPVAAF